MGKNSSSFTRKESFILVRGLLPEIILEATESCIGSTLLILHSYKGLDFCSFCETDFEFIDVNRKQAGVPMVPDGQDFKGRCIKGIASLRAVYIKA